MYKTVCETSGAPRTSGFPSREVCTIPRLLVFLNLASPAVRVEDVRQLSVFEHRYPPIVASVWWEHLVSNDDVPRHVPDSGIGRCTKLITVHHQWIA